MLLFDRLHSRWGVDTVVKNCDTALSKGGNTLTVAETKREVGAICEVVKQREDK